MKSKHLRKLFSKPKVYVLVGLIALLSTVSALLSQNQPTIAGSDTGKQAEKPARYLSENDYWPLSQDDPRIRLSGLTYDRRFAKNGSGEFLDVVFYLNNLTSKPVQLIGFVMAFWESDAVDKRARSYIPYPNWRKRDYDKEKRIVHFIRISPKDVSADAVWDYKDPEFFKQTMILSKRRNSIIGNQRPVTDLLPPFWKYIEYARYNPDQGLPFTLFGEKGPADNQKLATNYQDPSQAELKTKVFKNIDQHTYTLEFQRRRTIYRTFHFSPYRADFKFFNRLAIIILDADRAKVWKDQMNRELKVGEERVDPIIIQRVMRIQTKMRNN